MHDTAMMVNMGCLVLDIAVLLLNVCAGRVRFNEVVSPTILANKKEGTMDLVEIMKLPQAERRAIVEAETAIELKGF